MKKKLFTLALASVAALGLASCNGGSGTKTTTTAPATTTPATTTPAQTTTTAPTTTTTVTTTTEEVSPYVTESREVYAANLGEFATIYSMIDLADNVSERFALEALAEAKLYESGVFLPTTSRGGSYAVSRVAPKSTNTTLWGSDEYRFATAIVVDGNNFLKASEREELKALWNTEAGKSSGEYSAKAKAYLAQKGYTLATTYNYGYTSDAETWDVLASSKQVDSEKLVNCVDGLLEYDNENTQRPALATSYEVSADGLTYTFHIRENVEWVTNEGQSTGFNVKADDWVAGLQHMTDADAGLDWLLTPIIAGYEDYVEGVDTDFSHVGIKAVDDNTLQITLKQATSYFLTMLSYSCFEPLCRGYYEQQGGKFGAEFDSAAATYLYGDDPQHIAYCGAFTITGFTKENQITFTANPKYWAKEKVNFQTMIWKYNDGTDVLKAYNDAKANTIAGASLNESALVKSKEEGIFNDYAYVTDTDSTAFCGFWNINRAGYANFNDETKMVSPKTDAQKELTKVALSNANFRLAVAFAIDRGAMNAPSVGEDLKYTSLTNGYTPGNFVKLDEEVQIPVGETLKTYPAGTFYGEIVQDQLDADGCPIKYFDREKKVSTGFDGWYNPTNSTAFLAAAVAELAAEGVTIDAQNPVYIDYPCNVSETAQNAANAVKQSIENVTGGLVKVNVIVGDSSKVYQAVGYSTTYGYEANYDLYTGSGWGPDYGDPSSYLDTMLPDFAGYMVKTLGIF